MSSTAMDSLTMNALSMNPVTRRQWLRMAALAGAGISMPRLLFANTHNDARFVFVILRGALDGLAAVPAYGDDHYTSMRGELALPSPNNNNGILKLDELFGLHPSLSKLHQRYRGGELTVFHAVASSYRERSHFDGQDLLENGTTRPHGANDGWLNRTLSQLPRNVDTEKFAMAFAQNIPLVLRGDRQVGSWAPSRLPETDNETLQRIADMYAGNEYFSSRLQAALATDAMATDAMTSGAMNADKDSGNELNESANGRRDPLGAIGVVMNAAGRMLKANDGPRIAVLEANGWDTHANQGAERGVLATRLTGLDNAIDSLRTALGDAWQRTAVLIVTEFGRTVAINGTRGTDHGTGSCALLVGGAVNGGKVIADWPGLAVNNLYQGRDLKPTLDLRSVFKGIAAEHLGINENNLEQKVFPDSRNAKPILDLMRA